MPIMKNKLLSLKISLNSFFVITVIFSIIQILYYIRDSMLLSAGSFQNFFSSYCTYMGTLVLPVSTVFVIVIFFIARRIEKVVCRLEKKEQVSEEEIEITRKRIFNFRIFILCLNLLGFTAGYIVDLIQLGKIGEIFYMERLFVLIANLASGAVYGSIQIFINNILFAKSRQLLNIHNIGSHKREKGMLFQSVLLISYVVIYSSLFIYNNTYNCVLEQEIIYSSVLEEGIRNNLSPEEVEQKYKHAIVTALKASSSRMQLEEDMVHFPKGKTDINKKLNESRIIFLIFLLFVAVIIILVQYTSSVDTRNQIRSIINKLKDLISGEGDLTKRIEICQFDEIGEVTDCINQFISQLNMLVAHVAKVSMEVSQTSEIINVSINSTSSATEEMLSSTNQVQKNTEEQMEIVTQTQDGFNTMFGSIREITENVDTQTNFAQDTSSSIEEMAANIKSINSMAEKTSKVAQNLVNIASEGSNAVNSSIVSIQEIEESSQIVAETVSIISGIAAQTNLLAMNAAIEAAHAGEKGKGFAVVADEVRKLAENSAARTKEIAPHIKDMTAKINNGVKLSEQVIDALGNILDGVKNTTNLIKEITSAMQEQSIGIDQTISSVNSLVTASKSIKAQTQIQYDQGKTMKELITTLNHVSVIMNEATREQRTGNEEIVKEIESILEMSGSNIQEVERLNKEIASFKIDSAII